MWFDEELLYDIYQDCCMRVLDRKGDIFRKYGKFVNNGGMVYSEFDINVHVIDPFDVPKEWYNNLSIDPGLNNPLSCHLYAVD